MRIDTILNIIDGELVNAGFIQLQQVGLLVVEEEETTLAMDLVLQWLLVMVVQVLQEQAHMLVVETELRLLLLPEMMELTLLVAAVEVVD
jgi:hypothetical protein